MATSLIGRHQASSSSSSVQKRWYDVFISYRGEDTGKNFTDHLYSRLNATGINTFRDKNELKRGEEISPEIVKAIHESKICIIVFSRNYATSKWCLDELVEIIKCRKQFSQLVLPIFYKVNPSDVRKQSGSFGEAFVKHDDDQKVNRNKVSSWRAALAEAGELSGWDLDATDGCEGDFINKIVEKISSELNHTYLHLAIHAVGINSRIKYMNSLLSVGTNDVRTVGIYGMGGIGKTTLAKAVFNHFFHTFECKSFLANVREKSKKDKNKIGLQKQLLYDLLKIEVKEVGSVDGGIELIKRRLCTKRVLLVLDDVDQRDQLIAFSCHSNSARKDCFAPGSKIIITTRHKHLLEQIEVSDSYMNEKLNKNDSLQLFHLHAFGTTDPVEDCTVLSRDVVGYCNGLPLALEVLGSCLREVKDITQWKKELEKLKKNPPSKIQDTLKISFDALDGDQKNIFLDIACFFIGMDKDYVTKILDGCGFSPTTGIGILNRRCLLTIDENKLMMHDVLRDMGRKIVCLEPFVYPEQRSRVWHWQDAYDVLRKCKGTHQIECLALNMENMEGPIKVGLKVEAFAAMHNLRLLQLNYVNITGGYEHISTELRWLCWHGFPLKSIPNNFNQEKLVVIDMQYSNLKEVTKGNKVLEKLKILDLSHSHLLTRITIDFSTLPNLEELILEDCRGLTTIDESIGSLDKLLLLNLNYCANLRNLPRSICMLKSLKILGLNGLKFDKFSKEMGLTVLLGNMTCFKKAPWFSLFSSWFSSRNISDSMSLLPTSLVGLTSLRTLSLQDCNLTEGAIPKDIWSLSLLETLKLRRNNFSSLPTNISRLPKLQTLALDGCVNLTSLPKLPSSLYILSASNTSLERLPDISDPSICPVINLADCFNLTQVPITENLLLRWYKRHCCYRAGDDVSFPYNEIPNWFINQRMGNVLSFQVPPDFIMMEGFVLCFIYEVNDDDDDDEVNDDDDDEEVNVASGVPFDYSVSINNVTKDFTVSCGRNMFDIACGPENDHLSLGFVRLGEFKVDSGDEVEFVIDTHSCRRCKLTVKKCGVIPLLINIEEVNDDDDDDEVNDDDEEVNDDDDDEVNDDDDDEVNDDDDDDEEVNDDDDDDDDDGVNDDDDNESARPCHYWSYDENYTLSTHVMMVAPQSTYSRRVPGSKRKCYDEAAAEPSHYRRSKRVRLRDVDEADDDDN